MRQIILDAHVQFLTGNPPTVDDRYSAGTAAFADLTDGLNGLNALYISMAIEQGFNGGTNIWSDVGIRSGWDRISGYVSTVGTAAATVALLSSANTTKAPGVLAGAGLGVATVIQFVNNLGTSKIGDKMKFVEFTRRAWDDLRIRTELTRSLKLKNDSLVNTLATFKTKVYDMPDANGGKASVVALLTTYISQFDDAMNDVLKVIAQDEAMVDSYIDKDGKPLPAVGSLNPDALASLQGVRASLADLRSVFPGFARKMALNSQVRATLLGIETKP